MSQPIAFFKKNKADYTIPNVIATASEAGTYAVFTLNRNNNSAWVTTGSVDANNTTFTVNMTDQHTVSDILLMKHNFKSFRIQYWNGSVYVDFSPAIHPTNSADTTSRFSVAPVSTSQIQITIYGTQVPNSDKYLYQLILTELIGQLQGWPIIKKPTLSRNKRSSQMLSGKLSIGENVGSFSASLNVTCWSSDADLSIIEALYNSNEGFLFWPCGGDQAQFSSVRQGYRLEDIYLVKCTNDYQPEWYQGLYKSGLGITINVAEVVA